MGRYTDIDLISLRCDIFINWHLNLSSSIIMVMVMESSFIFYGMFIIVCRQLILTRYYMTLCVVLDL